MSASDDSAGARLRVSGKFFYVGGEKIALKGVTYGPFAKRDSDGAGLPELARMRDDLDLIASLGVNVVRVYEEPVLEFLDACAERKLKTLLSVPWTDHVDFMHERSERIALARRVKEVVNRFRGHAAVGGYFVGNEIQSTLVRWLGVRKVKLLLEEMIEKGKEADGNALFAYANYPSTEYLNPDNADFVAFNIYLEEREAFAKYFARLQNLAGDKPLLISEFGVDTKSHGRNAQTAMVDWELTESLGSGGAGSVVFAFTDAWYRGGNWVEGWDFGLVDRDRQPKPAYEELAKRLPLISRPADALDLSRTPKISVIVCTYNGEKTIRQCLQSLKKLNYPDYEILVVDDGSGDATPQIVREFSEVNYVLQEHRGLSAARNRGASESSGEILAFTDDDCEPDEDWLLYLAHGFLRDGYDAAGGPNIPPAARNLVQACVTAAPGSPSHVLLTDRVAEHLPGCNLAVTREAFDRVGGFAEEYRRAGDDVDFCWRLEEQGAQIGYLPGAFVWHFRRDTVWNYLKQQIGYGKAEALLIGRHAQRFGRLGGARWHGVVYQSGQPLSSERMPRIYQGVFGYAPFQTIYAQTQPELFNAVTSFPWVALVVLLLVLGLFTPALAWCSLTMFLVTLGFTIRESMRRRIEKPFQHLGGRLMLAFLCTAQPILRGGARFIGSLRRGVTPRGPLFGGKITVLPKFGVWKRVGLLALWSEKKGYDRDTILSRTVETLKPMGWPFTLDNGWRDWDLEVRKSRWWMVRMTSVTEYHEDESKLTRVRFSSKATTLTLAASAVIAVSLLFLAFKMGSPLGFLWLVGGYFLWWVFLEVRHRQLVEELAHVVVHLAHDIGFDSVTTGDAHRPSPAK